MKKLILSIILFTTFTAFAQIQDSIIYLKVPIGLGGATTTKFVNTTANIIGLNTLDSTKQLYVSDTTAGGTFNQYLGNDPVDSAIVFQDALGRKWKRNIPNGAINVRWFGAAANPFDSYSAITRAINYHKSHKGTYVYIPNLGNNSTFYSSQTLNMTGDIIIKGDPSAGYSPTSKISFPSNKKGIYFSVGNLTISDLIVAHAAHSIPDSTAHGIELHGVGIFTNVTILDASGDNLHIDACYSDGTNADQSTFTNCKFLSALNNGVYLTGCDANIIIFQNCNASDNGHWGFYDAGFLGNTYIQCQTNNNGSSLDVIVNYNGHGYAARNYIGINNINQKPDAVGSSVWVQSEGYGTRSNWDSTKKYYSGGAYANTTEDAKNQYQNCYSEGNQPPSMFSGRAQVLGGLQSAGLSKGVSIYSVFGQTNITSALNVFSPGNSGDVGGGGYISASNFIQAPYFFFPNNGGPFFTDGTGLQYGTGVLGGSTGLRLRSGGFDRISIDKTTGFVRIGNNNYLASDEQLAVDGNLSLNGKVKVNGSFGSTGQALISGGTGTSNRWGNLDSTVIPALATITTNTANIAANTTNIAANTTALTGKLNLTGGTVTGVVNGLTASASDSSAKFGTTAFVKQQIAAVPKADSAFAGYGIKFDSVYVNNRWVINLKVDSAKIATDNGLNVTGSGGTYNAATRTLNLTGGGTAGVDLTTDQDVRGVKKWIGSTASDAAPMTEQLSASGWTSTGWTGTWGAGFTHSTGNTTALTNTTAALNSQAYQIAYTVSGRNAGSFTIMFGGVSLAGLTATGVTGPTSVSTGTLSITPTTDFDGTIIISIKSIGFSSPSTIWTASDGTNALQLRRPIAANSIFIGFNSGRKNTTGTNNLFFGDMSGQSNTTASGNAFFGTSSFAATTVGANNVGFGGNTGLNNTEGFNNTYVGYAGGTGNTKGFNNSTLGYLALFGNQLGNANTAVGANAGRYITGGSTTMIKCDNCTFIGAETKAGADNLVNVSAIGYQAVSPTTSNSMQIGGPAVTQVNISGQVGIANGTNSNSAVNLSQLQAAASSNTFAPTLTNTTNVTSSSYSDAIYQQIGNTVTAKITGSLTPNATGAVELTITLPVTTATTSQTGIGTLSVTENAGTNYPSGAVLLVSGTTFKIRYISTNTASTTFTALLNFKL